MALARHRIALGDFPPPRAGLLDHNIGHPEYLNASLQTGSYPKIYARVHDAPERAPSPSFPSWRPKCFPRRPRRRPTSQAPRSALRSRSRGRTLRPAGA